MIAFPGFWTAVKLAMGWWLGLALAPFALLLAIVTVYFAFLGAAWALARIEAFARRLTRRRR